jgi:hypothetical protein
MCPSMMLLTAPAIVCPDGGKTLAAHALSPGVKGLASRNKRMSTGEIVYQ